MGTATGGNDCQFICDNYDPYPGANVLDWRWDGRRFEVIQRVIPNDGIVSQASQMAWPGAAQYMYQGSNHFQIRGDANGHDAFHRAMSSGDGDPFFKCSPQ